MQYSLKSMFLYQGPEWRYFIDQDASHADSRSLYTTTGDKAGIVEFFCCDILLEVADEIKQ